MWTGEITVVVIDVYRECERVCTCVEVDRVTHQGTHVDRREELGRTTLAQPYLGGQESRDLILFQNVFLGH